MSKKASSLCTGTDAPLRPPGSFDPTPVKRGEVRQSKMGRRRAMVLLLIHLAVFAHIAHWQIAGKTVSPVEPSEAMYTVANGVMNAGTILLGISILSTLVLGRWFCGWACHMVAMQDLSAWLLKRMGIRPRPVRSRWLMVVPLLAGLHLFLFPAFIRWWQDTPSPEMRNGLLKSEFWETFPGFWIALLTLLVSGFFTVYLLGAKGFCTYACPYGGFFGVVDRFAPARIRVTDACKGCGHCSAVCTSNVLVHQEVHEFGAIVDPGCMKCLDCVSVCPENALYFGFGRPAAGTAPRVKHRKSRPRMFSHYEEFALASSFALSLMVWRGAPEAILPWAGHLYGEVPLLFALGLSACTAFVLVFLWRTLRRPEVAFQKWVFRKDGKYTKAGRMFAVFASLWLVFVLHSAATQMLMWSSRHTWLATDVISADVWRQDAARLGALPDQFRQKIEDADDRLAMADAIGLFPDWRIAYGHAWFALCAEDLDAATRHIDAAIASKPDWANLRYDRGRILLLRHDFTDAARAFEAAKDRAREGGKFHTPLEKIFSELRLLGQADLSEGLAAAVLEQRPDDHALRLLLAQLRLAQGKSADAWVALEPMLQDPPPHDDLPQLVAQLVACAQEDPKAARRPLEQAVARHPDNWRLPIVLFQTLAAAKEFTDACNVATAMTQRWPTDGLPWSLVGQAKQQLGDLPGAHAAFTKAHEANPEKFPKPPPLR